MAKYKLDVFFLKRFASCLGIILPGIWATSTLLFIMLLGLSLAQQLVIYNVGLLPSQFFSVLGAKDSEGFKSVVFFALGMIFAISIFNAAVNLVSGILHVQWRGLMTEFMHGLYFSQSTAYHINSFCNDIDNADQRLTQDVDRFCLVLSDMSAKLIISPLTIVYYSYQCFSNAGYIGPVSIYAYFILGSIINRMVMAPIVGLVVKQEEREGNFRFIHMNVRMNTEAIALMRSEKVEQCKASKALQDLMSTQYKIQRYEFWLNFAVNLFDYLGSILSYVVIAIPIFAGYYNHLDSVSLSSLISRNAFVSMYLINCFSTLMDLSGKITDMAGYTHRIGELISSLDSISKCCTAKNESFKQHCRSYSKESTPAVFELTGIDCVPPSGGGTLIKDLNLTIKRNKSILITGKTGAGKSSLLRILSNLWQPCKGQLVCYIPVSPSGVMFVPQQPFLTTGSLVDQVIYPLPQSSFYENVDKLAKRVESCIESVGLSSLIERIGGVDIPVDWNTYKGLSPGETQRICFARLFFHKPVVAVLDEPTSALGVTEEDCFYVHCAQLGITVISVGHRPTLRRYHDIELHLDGSGGWKLAEIGQDGGEPDNSG